MAKFGIIVVIGISLTFIQKVPEMINAIFGTQGGLTDAKSFVYQGLQIASAGAGAVKEQVFCVVLVFCFLKHKTPLKTL